jgi:hypothetical protein
MSEAAIEAGETASSTKAKPWQFGGPDRDPVELGRKGGIASGLSRRLRPQRQLEEKILASKNGAAILKVLELRRAREAELMAEELRRDKSLVELELFEIDIREQVEEVVADLEQRRAELARVTDELDERQAQLATDDGLAKFVEEVGRARLAVAVELLGWYDDVDADADAESEP